LPEALIVSTPQAGCSYSAAESASGFPLRLVRITKPAFHSGISETIAEKPSMLPPS
jgi:hypothetical protein